MAQLTKAAFLAKYNDALTGLYKAGQIAGIDSSDHRSLVQDLEDSVLFLEDLDALTTDILILSGSVLNANTLAVALVAAGGAGKFLVPDRITMIMNYNSVPYATNTDITIQYSGGTKIFTDQISGFLSSAADRVVEFVMPVVDAKENEALQFFIENGNPTGGNSNITIRIKYKIITI